MMAICLPGESILGIVRGRRGAQIQKLAITVPKLFLMTDHAHFRVVWIKGLAITIRWQVAMIRVACPTMRTQAVWIKRMQLQWRSTVY
jgi:hypothetical protein